MRTVSGTDHHRVGKLARSCRRSGLIQKAHSFGDLALCHHGEPFECNAEHFHIRRTDGASYGRGFLAQAPGGDRIALTHERNVRLLVTEERVLGRGRQTIEQALGTLNPAVSDGSLAAKIGVVVGQPDGDSRRRTGIVGLTEQTIGALPGIDAGGVVLEPPACHPEAFECLRQLGISERALEAHARFFPATPGEGITAGLEAIGG